MNRIVPLLCARQLVYSLSRIILYLLEILLNSLRRLEMLFHHYWHRPLACPYDQF